MGNFLTGMSVLGRRKQMEETHRSLAIAVSLSLTEGKHLGLLEAVLGSLELASLGGAPNTWLGTLRGF